MKKRIQLLFFVIPIVVIFVLLYVMTIPPKVRDSSFPSYQNYTRQFLNDSIFAKALFNTILLPLLIGIMVGIVMYIIKLNVTAKIKSKIISPAFYVIIFICPAVIPYIMLQIAIKGLPMSVYSTQTIINHISSYSLLVNSWTILISILIGVLNCFIFWIVDSIILINRKAQNNN